MLAAVVLFLAAPAPAPLAFDVCDACKRGKTCKPHIKSDRVAIRGLEAELTSEDPKKREAALRQVAELALDHENAPSSYAAEVLAKAALEDDQLRLRRYAVQLLCRDQHPETAVEGMVDVIKSFEQKMWSLVADLTGPDDRHGTVNDAMGLLEETMRSARRLRDDRIVNSLASILRTYPLEMRGEPVAMSTVHSLLDLGSKDAVQAVVEQFNSRQEESRRRQIHSALASFARREELEKLLPRFEDDLGKAWPAWFKKHRQTLPKKLGKWKGVKT